MACFDRLSTNGIWQSPVIQLRPYRAQSFARDTVRRTANTADHPLAPQLLENRQRTVVKPPSVAIHAVDLDYPPFSIKAVDDRPALRERVQHALFIF